MTRFVTVKHSVAHIWLCFCSRPAAAPLAPHHPPLQSPAFPAPTQHPHPRSALPLSSNMAAANKASAALIPPSQRKRKRRSASSLQPTCRSCPHQAANRCTPACACAWSLSTASLTRAPAPRCKRSVCGGSRSHISPTSTRAFQLNASVDARGCRRASLAWTPSPAPARMVLWIPSNRYLPQYF
jgi:hypothetical protein